MGPKKTLRFVAQYADACNFFGGAEDTILQDRLEILKRHCDDVGRPYQEIEMTVLQTADFSEGTVQDVISRGQTLRDMGFQHIIFNVKGLYTAETLASFTDEIIPALKA
jgi:hypothetical protein